MSAARYAYRYMAGGSVAHALGRASDAAAVCGMGPWLSRHWRGTGSQEEYERAAALPLCRRCERLVGGSGDHERWRAEGAT